MALEWAQDMDQRDVWEVDSINLGALLGESNEGGGHRRLGKGRSQEKGELGRDG